MRRHQGSEGCELLSQQKLCWWRPLGRKTEHRVGEGGERREKEENGWDELKEKSRKKAGGN